MPDKPLNSAMTSLMPQPFPVAIGFSDGVTDGGLEPREVLQQQARLFDAITSTTPDFVYVFDRQGRFLYANRRLLEVWGMKFEEVVGKTCRELGYEQWHHDMHMREIAEVIETKKSIKGEVPFKAPKTGIYGIYEYIFNPVISPSGEVEMITGTTRDVTDRKATEESLREREARYRELFTSMTEGFCVLEKKFTAQGEIDFLHVEANPAVTTQSAFGEITGRTIRELIVGSEAEEWIEIYDESLRTGASKRFERELRMVARTFEVNVYRVGDGTKGRVGVLFRDITARRRAEERFHRQLRLTETIAQRAGEALFLMDAAGRVTFMNPAAEKMFGWSLAKMEGQVLHDLLHYKHEDGEDFPMAECPLGEVMRSGTTVRDHDDVFFRRDGQAVHVRCSNAPVIEKGEITGAVLVVADTTERKRQEEQLQRNHDTFYQLVQKNPFGIYVVDADFKLRQVSLGAQKVFENVRPLLGRDFADVLRTIWAEPFAGEAIKLFRHTLETGEPYTSPSTIERRNDISVVEAYDWRIERLMLPDGRFGVVCYFYDLSERQRWEAALQLSEERFQLAVRATNDAIWDWDLATNSLWWNEGVRSLFGFRMEEVSPTVEWWHNQIHPEDHNRIVSELVEMLKAGETFWRGEYRFRRANGDYADVLDRGYVLRNAEGKPLRMLGAMQDLTERKQAESALARAQEALRRHADDLEQLVEQRTTKLREMITELETLSYSISHDMRAPLRAMQGFSQALLDDYRSKLDAQGVDYLDRIKSASERLDALIQDILLYNSVGRERLEVGPVELGSLVRELMQTYHPDQLDRVEIQTPLPTVLGHEAFLSQIFSNLLTNALKFVPRGEEAHVRVRSEEMGKFVKIWVEDRGIGIAPQHVGTIFQVFGRVYSEAEYPGTGIGLPIVKRAVQRLGGEVGVESTVNEGSRFWFTLRKA